MRVCVIGAGLAGLAAAEALLDGGIEPVVLEARDRVGGRVWSQQLSNEATIERGAEYSEPEHTVFRSTVARLGLRLAPTGMSYTNREPRGGLGATRYTLLDVLSSLRLELAAHPDGARVLSAGAFLRDAPGDAGAREAIAARLQVTYAYPVDDLPAEAISHMSFDDDEGLRVAGGNQGVALHLAARLDDRVHLGERVDQVSWWQDGVRIRTDSATVDAAACIVAIPASVIDQIAFDLPLPGPKADALARVTYGHAAKLFVPLTRPAPPSAVLSVPDHFWTWTITGSDGMAAPVVHAFAGSAPALRRLRVDAGPATWVERLRALRPDLALDPDGAVLSTWSDDPFVRAAYSVRDLTSPADEAVLAQPVGSLHFAGEHTAGPWAGTMDGALRSGMRAAGEVIAHA